MIASTRDEKTAAHLEGYASPFFRFGRAFICVRPLAEDVDIGIFQVSYCGEVVPDGAASVVFRESATCRGKRAYQ